MIKSLFSQLTVNQGEKAFKVLLPSLCLPCSALVSALSLLNLFPCPLSPSPTLLTMPYNRRRRHATSACSNCLRTQRSVAASRRCRVVRVAVAAQRNVRYNPNKHIVLSALAALSPPVIFPPCTRLSVCFDCWRRLQQKRRLKCSSSSSSDASRRQ